MNPYTLQKTPVDILTQIARKHKILRKKKKISQAELAKRSGVSLGSIKRFEQTGKIAFESLLQLAQILDRLDEFDFVFEINDELERVEKLFSDKTRS